MRMTQGIFLVGRGDGVREGIKYFRLIIEIIRMRIYPHPNDKVPKALYESKTITKQK